MASLNPVALYSKTTKMKEGQSYFSRASRVQLFVQLSVKIVQQKVVLGIFVALCKHK